MTLAVIAGLGFGGALCLLASGLQPGHQPLAVALERLGRPVPVAAGGNSGTLDARLGLRLRQVGPVERVIDRLRTDLRLLDRDPNEQAAQFVVAALVGLLWAPVVAVGARLVGVDLPVVIPMWLALAGATLGAAIPYRQVREQAAEARAAFGHALSAYCDVVGMAMSAGREAYASMFDAAAVGDGMAFRRLREALQTGFMAGEKPWDSLRRLGDEIGVEDLVELGAAIGLAGDEGAAVRDTLASKARSIRERLVTDAERHAAEATERMAIPGAMLLVGFLWFLAFPALFLIFQQSH